MIGLQRLEAPASFDLWWVDLQREPSPDEVAGLSNAERARCARFVFERDRRRYRAAHCALRHLLAVRCRQRPETLVFTEGAFGKPRLEGAATCAFSLSHSEDWALVLMADEGEIGVDVEALRSQPDRSALAAAHFTPRECAALAGLSGSEADLAFLRCWTRKEACLKAVGSGFAVDAASVDVGVDAAPQTVLVAGTLGPQALAVQSFEHEHGFVGALARVL